MSCVQKAPVVSSSVRACDLTIDPDLSLVIHGLKHQPHPLVSPVPGVREAECPGVCHHVPRAKPGHHPRQGGLHTEGDQDLLLLTSGFNKISVLTTNILYLLFTR